MRNAKPLWSWRNSARHIAKRLARSKVNLYLLKRETRHIVMGLLFHTGGQVTKTDISVIYFCNIHINCHVMGTIKKKLGDTLLIVSWREISRKYFGKKASWIYGKLDGEEEGNPDSGFTEEEKQTLKESLIDVANSIISAAEEL